MERRFTMRTTPLLIIAALALAAPAAALAQDELDGVEMDVMEADETPNEASTRVLTLPEDASDTAREHAQFGLDTANSAREGGAQLGQDAAEAARERGGAPEGTPTPDNNPGRP
jgi:hypothetical protein